MSCVIGETAPIYNKVVGGDKYKNSPDTPVTHNIRESNSGHDFIEICKSHHKGISASPGY